MTGINIEGTNKDSLDAVAGFIERVFDSSFKNEVETEGLTAAFAFAQQVAQTPAVSVSHCDFYSDGWKAKDADDLLEL